MAVNHMSAITCAGCNHGYAPTALFCPNCGRPKAREQVTDALIGKVLGERFQILAAIGTGASGTIYRAEHVTLRRKVAIKVLHNELSRDDLAVERFRREATTVAEIDNEHIVEIHDFGRTGDGRLYLAMELLEGETLDNILAREGTLSIERAADILIQLGEALMEAHAIGYVHRDLRPRNVYLAVRRGKANFVKLLDFGLAKLVETDASAASTSLGMTFGDPRYMSPEQARGDRIDRRADIYQLGCVAYEMLTGAPPFAGNRVFDILTKQVTATPEPLPTKRPGVPLWVEAAVAKMLAKDPENRFATTTRLVDALRRGLETGEVMEDEIARRRESIPPPSVSRVMQRMGIEAPRDPEPTPRALDKSTVHGHAAAPMPVAPTPTPAPVPAPAPAAVAPAPAAPAVQPPRATAAAAPLDDEPPAPRQRTGTPKVVSTKGLDVTQHPVAGLIDAKAEAPAPDDPAAISQVWYDDESGDPSDSRAHARKLISPSTTDLYDDAPTGAKKKWPMFVAIGGIVAVMGVAIALSMSGGKHEEPPAAKPVAVTAPVVDAAPSLVLPPEPVPVAGSGSGSAELATTPAKPAPGTRPATTPTTTAGTNTRPTTPTTTLPPGTKTDLFGNPIPGTGPVTQPPVLTPTITEKKDPSLTNEPQDPYNTHNGTDTSESASTFATRGEQQLASNDTAGAAASFKKALELDPKNASALTGMGEIALRQGLFGDAIAHLTKATRVVRTARVYTLLGEAYLNSGNNKLAQANFKVALQIDPDNARARDGYNEATSRVPAPTDEPAPTPPAPAPPTPAPTEPTPYD